jgi:hypothetical protein
MQDSCTSQPFGTFLLRRREVCAANGSFLARPTGILAVAPDFALATTVAGASQLFGRALLFAVAHCVAVVIAIARLACILRLCMS